MASKRHSCASLNWPSKTLRWTSFSYFRHVRKNRETPETASGTDSTQSRTVGLPKPQECNAEGAAIPPDTMNSSQAPASYGPAAPHCERVRLRPPPGQRSAAGRPPGRLVPTRLTAPYCRLHPATGAKPDAVDAAAAAHAAIATPPGPAPHRRASGNYASWSTSRLPCYTPHHGHQPDPGKDQRNVGVGARAPRVRQAGRRGPE